jgi:hypothetical protein
MSTTQHLDAAHDELDRDAYNQAFYALGLRWHWDAATYAELGGSAAEARTRLRTYLQRHQPHLLTAYDADFLADAIESHKLQLRRAAPARRLPPAARCNWAALQSAQVGA